MIHLEDINEDNWRIPLSVSKQQEKYVSDPMRLLARAYAYRSQRSYACMIYQDDEAIGMALYYDCPELKAYNFNQFFIDERYQGKGYGKEAVKIIIERMRNEHKYNKIILCYKEGNSIAKHMYESIGFIYTGKDDDEIIMELMFSDNKRK